MALVALPRAARGARSGGGGDAPRSLLGAAAAAAPAEPRTGGRPSSSVPAPSPLAAVAALRPCAVCDRADLPGASRPRGGGTRADALALDPLVSCACCGMWVHAWC
jgi:hypothetical protein